MTTDVYSLIEASVLAGLDSAFPSFFLNVHVCIPARGADAGCYCPEPLTCIETADRLNASLPFPNVLGAPLVAHAEGKNSFLRFRFTDGFFDALIERFVGELPYPANDLGDYALNRMLALSRKPRMGCPKDANVQRALLVSAGLAGGRTSLTEARKELLSLSRHLPPGKRRALLDACGGVGDAAARILFYRLQKG